MTSRNGGRCMTSAAYGFARGAAGQSLTRSEPVRGHTPQVSWPGARPARSLTHHPATPRFPITREDSDSRARKGLLGRSAPADHQTGGTAAADGAPPQAAAVGEVVEP